MSDLTDTDFPPLDPQPFVTEEGREIERLRAELAAVQKQRDEARREVCEDESYNHKCGVTPREVAEDRGWDCFKGGGA